MFLLYLIALAASLVSVGLALVATLAWVSRPRAVAGGGGDVLAVIGVPSAGTLESATVRALAAAGGPSRIRLTVGRLDGDLATGGVLESVRREFPEFDARSIAFVTDHRKVVEPSLAFAAMSASEDDPVMILGSSVRPSSHAISRLAGIAVDDRVYSAIPATHPADIGLFSIQADVSRMTLVLYGLFGSRGVLPTVTVASRRTIGEVFSDPLAQNRPSAGAALHDACRGARFVPVDVPVSFGSQAAFLHLSMLARVCPWKYAVCCVSLAAGPLSLIAVLAAGLAEGRLPVLAALALVLSVLSRGVGAIQWSARSAGVSRRLAEALLSPLADAPALVRGIAAATARTVTCGRSTYTMHGNGLMSSGFDNSGAMGGRS